MGVKLYPNSRLVNRIETLILPLDWTSFLSSAEAQLTGATTPSIPTYDTAVAAYILGGSQVGTGTTANIFWVIITLPTVYIPGTNLTVSMDDIYVLAGDAVIVAATLDLEAFPYDSTNGDFSNADINATVAQAIAAAFATDSFTLTGTNLTAEQQILLRFTSSVQITSAGGAGTGRNGFNFPRITYTGRI